jgi:CubicO group peptidase (beta-lactamase class C family)
VRHGRLAFERYFGPATPEALFDVRSVTKSVVSALTGIAVQDGDLGLDDSIAGYLGPAYVVDGADAAVRVRHLLTMTSGFQWSETNGPDYNLWVTSPERVQYLLDRPHAAAPGAQFTYNSAAVHVLGVVLQNAVGVALPQFAAERLLRPLGIEAVLWEPSDPGTVNGGSGIQLRARDLLKLGQLFLQRGRSAGTSVVPEAWVDGATRPQFSWRTSFGVQQGLSYGLLWWVSDAEPAAFLAWGYGGQFVYVVPSLELVVVATTDWRGLSDPDALARAVLGVIVQGVLPAAR